MMFPCCIKISDEPKKCLSSYNLNILFRWVWSYIVHSEQSEMGIYIFLIVKSACVK
uniref:Uncharacterized protein n=1 Tax=Ciona intestinalis TaxID=7719 RepID=H2XS62_CIOIN